MTSTVDRAGGRHDARAGDGPRVEPVAIVGLACRLPGDADTPAQLWEYLMAGREAVGELPPERWAPYAERGADTRRVLRRATARGNFIRDPSGFDAEFFAVAPREAELMDPQQRIAMETTWEALEDAGIPPHTLAGSDTAVYMGVAVDDYGRRMLEDLPALEAWCGVGSAYCGVANRISYLLDLRGPSLATDTACSSSLVAIHLAAGALRAGECRVAVAGGVNVMAAPGMTVVLDLAGATSPQGRSRPFEADADGYGRGEGAGVVVLKLLRDALADGDPIRAVLRGSAITQDGRTNGIMAPNPQAQEAVARIALRRAGIDPHTVDYVEAHGTGTNAGDPIEAAALAAVFGRRGDDPCVIGSVKANIGHLEAGAGVAGVIKTVLALERGFIPPQPHAGALNPAIPWAQAGLRLATQPLPFPDRPWPRRAGVSAFGYGGTVGHLVLEQAPEHARRRPDGAPGQPAVAALPGSAARLFPVTGSTPAALREYAAALADALGASGPDLADLHHSLWQRRTHLAARAAVVARDVKELRYELRKLAAEAPTPNVVTATALEPRPEGAVWVFSGHGSQWAGMGRELLAGAPAFGAVLDAIDPIYRAELGCSPRDLLAAGELGGVDRIQALIFAVQVGLAAVWRELGLRPSAVIGHSVGEVAAAVTAGVFSLEDGARLICRRSMQVGRAAGGGAMAMVAVSFAEAERLAHEHGDRRGGVVAAIESSTTSSVVAGTPEAVAAFRARCEADGLLVRGVASDVAFHSPQMDPLLNDLRATLVDLAPAAPAIPLYSTTASDPRSEVPRDGDYWAANLRDPVRLATAVTAAVEDGHRVFLEISAHPVVTHSIVETLRTLNVDDVCVTGTLRRGLPEQISLLLNLGTLFAHGCPVDADRHGIGGALVPLPRIAWQHRPFWRDRVGGSLAVGPWHDVEARSLLGAPVEVAGTDPVRVWRTLLDYDNRPYPGTHPVFGVEIVPAAVVLTTFLDAVGRRALTDVRFRVPITLAAPREVQIVERSGQLTLSSRPVAAGPGGSEGAWETHVTCGIRDAPEPAVVDLAALQASCPRELPSTAVVDRLHDVGVTGSGFEWTTTQLRAGSGQLLARVRSGDAGGEPSQIWAGFLDAVTTVAPLLLDDGGEPRLRITSAFGEVALVSDAAPDEVLVHLAFDPADRDCADAVVLAEDGKVLAVVRGLQYGAIDRAGARGLRRSTPCRPAWRPVERAAGPLATLVLVDEDAGPLGPALDLVGARAGTAVVHVSDVDALPGALAAGPTAPVAVAVIGAARSWRAVDRLLHATRAVADTAAVLWSVTVGGRERTGAAPSLAAEPLWALGRVIGAERPQAWGGTIDLTGQNPEADAEALLSLLGGPVDADLLAPRDGTVQALRWVPLDAAVDCVPGTDASAHPDRDPAAAAVRCRPEGTYLVTDGLDHLGLFAARWLARRGARRIVLAGSAALPPRQQWGAVTAPDVRSRIDAVGELEALGVTVRVVAVDLADPAALATALSPDALGLPPVLGVVRALPHAGLGPVAVQAAVRRVEAVETAFPAAAVDFMLTVTALAGAVGAPGFAGDALTLATVDALADARIAGGGRAAVLAWGADADGTDQPDWLGAAGLAPATVDDGFSALEVALARGARSVAVVCALSEEELGAPGPALLRAVRPASAVSGEHGGRPAEDFAALPPQERHDRIAAEVAAQIGAVVHLAAGELDMRRPLSHLGLDSVMSLAIRVNLEKRFGLDLPATLLWSRPTGDAVAQFLVDALAPAQD